LSALSMLRAAQSNVDVPMSYQGLQGPGVPNLTPKIPPPQRPQPEEEQGVGRGPGERWEHRAHNTTVNPYWYLETPYLYDVPYGSSVPIGTETPLPIEFTLAVYQLQIRERQAGPGLAPNPNVLPQPTAGRQAQVRTI
jgi:hypothetical protein